MPINGSPWLNLSGGNENSSGAALPLCLLAFILGVATLLTPSPSQQNVALACLFASPARTLSDSQWEPLSVQEHPRVLGPGHWCLVTLDPTQHSSFGCLVNYHLAHDRLTHIQRLFGVEACSTPVLNRTQQV